MKYTEIIEDNRLKQFMLGSMLGDGSIPKKDRASVNYRLTLGHGSKQLSYLKWKVSLLQEYELSTGVITRVIAKSNRYKEGFCLSFHSKSKANPYFNNYRELFYVSSKKIVPEIISDIDSFGIAIWYMDDGYLTVDKYREDRKFYKFSTDGFSIEYLSFLIKIFIEKFGIKVTINYGRELRISERDNDKFFNLISANVLPEFYYKLHTSPE